MHVLETKVGKDHGNINNTLVYHLQMQLSEANELHAREIHQAKEKNCILKREIDYKDSQSKFK